MQMKIKINNLRTCMYFTAFPYTSWKKKSNDSLISTAIVQSFSMCLQRRSGYWLTPGQISIWVLSYWFFFLNKEDTQWTSRCLYINEKIMVKRCHSHFQKCSLQEANHAMISCSVKLGAIASTPRRSMNLRSQVFGSLTTGKTNNVIKQHKIT